MAYTPPQCDSADFSLQPIKVPDCSAADFNLIRTEEQDVYFHHLKIRLKVSDVSLDIVEIIDFHSIKISTGVSDLEIEILSSDVFFESLRLFTKNSDFLVYVDPDTFFESIRIQSRITDFVIDGGREYNLPSGIDSSLSIKYKNSTKQDISDFEIIWGTPDTTANTWEIKYQDTYSIDLEFTILWESLNIEEIHNTILWGNSLYTDKEYTMNWYTLDIMDRERVIVWANSLYTDSTFLVNYLHLEPNDKERIIVWGDFSHINRDCIFNYNVISGTGFFNEEKDIAWGRVNFDDLCKIIYYPPDACKVRFGLQVIGDYRGACIGDFKIPVFSVIANCPYDHHESGGRDPYVPDGEIEGKYYPYYPPPKDFYSMLNSIYVRRLPDMQVVEVTSISINYDKGNYVWQLSMAVAHTDKVSYIDLIKPRTTSVDKFVDVEVNINGWRWIFRIEDWDENRAFGSKSYTVTGRSRSMELGNPQCPEFNFTYDPEGTQPTAGAQIIDDILAGTILGIDDKGWSADWTAYQDIFTGFNPYSAAFWGIPANSFSWTTKTQIGAIQELIASIGAFIVSHPEDKILIFKPEFGYPPWYWNTDNVYRPRIDHVIRALFTEQSNCKTTSKAIYTGFYVSGQNTTTPQRENILSGILIAEVYREGIAKSQRIYGSDVTSPYLYNWQAAAELGRMSLCDVGDWEESTLTLFSLAHKDDDAPTIAKLVYPGDFLEIIEEEKTWYCKAQSTQIQVTLDGNGAWRINQILGVNRYTGS